MGIIKETLKKQVDSQKLQTVNVSSGTILTYNKTTNMATVTYQSPSGDGLIQATGVPISSTLGGLTNSGVRPGQHCTIVFLNGNPNAPLITGINENNYKQKTCTDQGAFLIDESIRESSTPEMEIQPMYNNWLDSSNTWTEKYKVGTDFSDIDIAAITSRQRVEADRYTDNEVGLTNLSTNSTLKMKDNGDIDIFVADNVGIRISKKMRKIYLYGFDINVNGEMDIIEILKKCRDCNHGGISEIERLIRLIDGDIEELKRCIAYTKQITGNIDIFEPLDNDIWGYENLKDNYYRGKYNSVDGFNYLLNQLRNYYKYFGEELSSARETWGLD